MKHETNGSYTCSRVLMCLALLGAPAAVLAQTDEIQVYDAAIADQGVFNVMVHSNFTPSGRKNPDYPGGIIPNHSVNGAVEWAYGVTDWMEQGLYFPVYSAYSQGRDGTLNGFKIRELFVKPHADEQTFFYGLNFEFSVNYHYWESRHITSELRPIIGLHLKPWDIIVNPIVDTNYTGGPGGLEFVPATRLAYNLNDKWAVAAETYSDFGTLRHFNSTHNQFQEGWLTIDHKGAVIDIETGIGVGYTADSDKVTLKLMVSRDINPKAKP